MIDYRFNRLTLSAVAVGVVFILGSAPAPDMLKEAVASQECDCSCAVFEEFRSRMEDLSEAVQSGEASAMTPELQQAAVCGAQCAMQWSQCGREGTAGAASDSASRQDETDDRTASSAAEAEASSGAGDPEQQVDASFPLGAPRDDLERFHGVYGDGDSGKEFFVAAAKRPEYAEERLPPGYLMIGAMWGDVAPWYMKSISETRFEQQWVNPGGEPVIVEFDVDGRGNARALVFDTVFDDRGRLQRRRDLPDGW